MLAVGIVTVLTAIPLAVPPTVTRVAESLLLKAGIPSSVRMRLGYCWTRTGPGLSGSLDVSIPNTSWRVRSAFGASPFHWHASAAMDTTAFSEADPLIAKLLADHVRPSVSNLTFSGSVAFTAAVERTWSMPVPVWKGRLTLADVSADADLDQQHVSLSGMKTALGASGIADHVDIDPIFVRAKGLSVGRFSLDGLSAFLTATAKAVLVTEATAGFCGGTASVYSLYLDPQSLSTGFTLFLDNIETGQALSALPDIRGTASGRHHGKLKVFVREGGKGIRIRDAFLYSVPGETGKIQLQEASAVTDNLALAGLDEDQRNNVANALTDLDYTVLRLTLTRQADDDMTVEFKIEGSATRHGVSAPVVLNLTFHGDFEQLINTGLKISGH